jgi:FAD:protein FMN transferase
MKDTRILMGMPITVEIISPRTEMTNIDKIFDYFNYVDHKFSTYKDDSEISLINRKRLEKKDYSEDMKTVMQLCEQTKQETDGFFDINKNGKLDPSGLVKGWAIYNAAVMAAKMGFENYYVEAGGDIQASGKNRQGKKWQIGIRNPFDRNENVKIIEVSKEGVATSGTYIRGQHIYNPHRMSVEITDIVSTTVIGPDIYEADRMATAAFAMGKDGINFIERLSGFEGYMIDSKGIATYTTGFNKYVINP